MARLVTPPGWVQVVVAGEVGAGKSTLINALLPRPAAATGIGSAVTTRVAAYEAPAHRLRLWDTPGFAYGGGAPTAELRAALDEINALGGAPSVAWFAWSSSSVRLTDAHRELITELHDRGLAVIAVLTKSSLRGRAVHAGEAEFAAFIASARLPLAVPAPIRVAAFSDRWAGLDSGGLEDLVAATHEVASPGGR